MTNYTNEKIIEEFVKKFYPTIHSEIVPDEVIIKLMKSFLLTSLQAVREDTLRRVGEIAGGMKKEIPKSINMTSFPDNIIKMFKIKDQGYNKALSDLQQKLKELK